MSITNNEREIIIANMKELLDEYDYNYNTPALEKIVDTWASHKETLIEAFKKHPNYVEGKFCIAFDSDYSREVNTIASRNFSRYLERLMQKYESSVPEVICQRYRDTYGEYNLPSPLKYFLTSLQQYAFRTLSDDALTILNNNMPEIHPHAGEKTSRVVNRVCTYLGYTQDPDYNREFAKYADSLSPMTIKRHTVISLNPIDYLTMSFGNSWASCHTIDKWNKRGMPNSYEGQYSSGTMSYMLDPSSMVFYTVDKDYEGNNYWSQPKINRQMFHWGEDKLVQGRLYPQSNDGNADEYTIYRQIVQEVMSICFDMPNLWKVSKGSDNASRYIYSKGTHYKDYHFFSYCTLSVNKSKPNDECFTVGASPICIECGYTHDVEENINCCTGDQYRCADCGCLCNEDDLHYIDGDYYCEDCCHYCECCEEWHLGEEYYIESERRYVCESCLDEYYTRCEHCDEYVSNDEVYRVTDEYGDEIYVCEWCCDHHYTECSECGEYHANCDMTEVANGNSVCDSCLEEKYAQCHECEEWYLMEDMVETRPGVFYCDDCYEDEDEEDEAV